MTDPGARSRSSAKAAAASARAAQDALLAEGAEAPEARARVVAGVAVAVADALGVGLPPLRLLTRWGSPVPVEVAPADATPALPGHVHEILLDTVARRAGGAYYTAPDVAAAVAGWALQGHRSGRPVVCDPAVGGGAFLLAAADVLAAAGHPREAVVADCLVGGDVDPVAAAVTEAVLALWCGGQAVPRIVVGDALALDRSTWPARPDVVVGNPPFLTQLGRATARRRHDAAALRRRFGAPVTAYADTAVLFLVLGVDLAGPGGTVALVLPESFLAARDARPARSRVLSQARLEALWVPSVSLFGAAVRVCVPILRLAEPCPQPEVVRVWRGMPPSLSAEVRLDTGALAAAPTWSQLLSAGSGVPAIEVEAHGTLGGWCIVSADFRQHYYGVAPFMVDDPGGERDDSRFPPLVTVGLIDPAACRWGRRRVRHHRRSWEAPRVDLARLEQESGLAPWARARLVPKVVVATQTRVVEAAVDVEGTWLPSTPLLSAVTPPERLWHLAAALLSPPVSAWALHRWGGTALSAGGLKLSAAQVRSLPSPPPGPDWDAAAGAVRRASAAVDPAQRRRELLAAAAASSRAYGVDDPAVLSWWEARLPGER